jgi:hypothetical protein
LFMGPEISAHCPEQGGTHYGEVRIYSGFTVLQTLVTCINN